MPVQTAGFVEIDGHVVSCAAVNGYAVRDSGVITAFGNVQDLPMYVSQSERAGHFTLRVALIGYGRDGNRIVELLFDDDTFDPLAVDRLQATVVRYNDRTSEQ